MVSGSFSIVEFPAESWSDVLHGRPEQRRGDVQQRISWPCAGGVPSSAGREGSTQRLHQVPGPAGHEEYVHEQKLQVFLQVQWKKLPDAITLTLIHSSSVNSD